MFSLQLHEINEFNLQTSEFYKINFNKRTISLYLYGTAHANLMVLKNYAGSEAMEYQRSFTKQLPGMLTLNFEAALAFVT